MVMYNIHGVVKSGVADDIILQEFLVALSFQEDVLLHASEYT